MGSQIDLHGVFQKSIYYKGEGLTVILVGRQVYPLLLTTGNLHGFEIHQGGSNHVVRKSWQSEAKEQNYLLGSS